MTLRYWTGFDEFQDDITLFPQSPAMRFASGSFTSQGAFGTTNAAYSYGKAYHFNLSAGVASIPADNWPALLFNLGDAFSNGNHVIFGFDYLPTAFSGICSLVSATGQQIMGVSVTSLGYLRAYGAWNGITSGQADGAYLAQAGSPITTGQDYYITVEMYSEEGGANAVLKVWNGADLVINWSGNLGEPSGIDWAWSDFLLCGSVGLGNSGVFEADKAYYDNFYFVESGGVEPIGRLGDIVRVGTLGATSEVGGQNIGYTRTGGTDVEDSVGLASNDGDTSYYEGEDVNDTVIFDSTDSVPGTPTVIFGVMAESYSRRTGAATRKIKPVVRDAAANYLGTESQVPALYGALNSIWTTRPSDGTALTKSVVEGLAFGVKISV